MKIKNNCILVLLVLLLVFSLMSCGTYKPGKNDDEGNNGGIIGGDSTIPGSSEEDLGDDAFTVTLKYKEFAFTEAQGIYCQWSDGYSIHTAEFDENGVARKGGLDGDYRVTLSALPEGFTYNPNIYTATNNARDITIELFEVSVSNASSIVGTGPYNCIHIDTSGVYRVVLDSADDAVFFQFNPRFMGTYAVESWADIVAQRVNPVIDVYGGNPQFKYFQKTEEDGGISEGYTSNFKHVMEIATESIGHAFTFAIKGNAKNNAYPVTIDFALTLNGEFYLDKADRKMIVPQANMEFQPDYSASDYVFVGAETMSGGNKIFDGTQYALWEEGESIKLIESSAHGEGKADKLTGSYTLSYKDTKTTFTFNPTLSGNAAGELVVVKERINPAPEASTELQRSTYQFTYDSRYNYVLLTYKSGKELKDLKLSFDKENELRYGEGDGYYHLYDSENGTYGPILYAHITSACRFLDLSFFNIEDPGNRALSVSNGTENYKLFIEGYNELVREGYYWVDELSATEKKYYAQVMGYQHYVNSDGVYGVTQELKEFLQKYSVSQLLFFDGNGHVETHPTVKVYAEEDNQWLFACGYYKER